MTETPDLAASAAVTSVAEVRTEHARRYLGQLCKHFAHKIPAEFDATSGRITFPVGVCRLAADDATLTLRLEAEAANMERLREIVASHLVRFAFREELAFDWRDA